MAGGARRPERCEALTRNRRPPGDEKWQGERDALNVARFVTVLGDGPCRFRWQGERDALNVARSPDTFVSPPNYRWQGERDALNVARASDVLTRPVRMAMWQGERDALNVARQPGGLPEPICLGGRGSATP